MDPIEKEWLKLRRDQHDFSSACIVLGGILKEHKELTGCIQAIGVHIIEKMELNEDRIKELSKLALKEVNKCQEKH